MTPRALNHVHGDAAIGHESTASAARHNPTAKHGATYRARRWNEVLASCVRPREANSREFCVLDVRLLICAHWRAEACARPRRELLHSAWRRIVTSREQHHGHPCASSCRLASADAACGGDATRADELGSVGSDVVDPSMTSMTSMTSPTWRHLDPVRSLVKGETAGATIWRP
jgi:hypothetical protein